MEPIRTNLLEEDEHAQKVGIKASIRIAIPSKKVKEATAIFRSLIEETRLQDGCLSCRLYQDILEDQSLMLEEVWMSQKDLERHLRSDKFLAVLFAMEMSAKAPEVRFEEISQCSGIETIERARAQPEGLK